MFGMREENKPNTYKVIFIFHKNVKPKHISTTLLQPVLFKEMEEAKGKEEAQRVERKQSTFLGNDKVKNLTLPPSIIYGFSELLPTYEYGGGKTCVTFCTSSFIPWTLSSLSDFLSSPSLP